ncbi:MULTISPECIES: SDR family oxidoreductase [Sulfitobacter]|uniref:Sugar epimerase YhfK n=1 Tax=Sulfitobacter dubius TaxID=218673 RepID=A0ABY3ZN33_9RHOB|nr:SDR family oxidoreductase [Sulfitobacter dubius]UOA15510.1 putative sugar epimerase YhfK [Sulfitobacter dubius]WOI29058.1 SDR family oxidoreductase [Sulfitobacter dubius]
MTMKILVAGATGKTGRLLVSELKDRGAEPIALVRDGSDTSVLPEGTEQRQGDLTNLQTGVCDGVDVVIFAAGSGGSTGPEMTEKVDREGAQRLVDFAREAKVGRFVMLSSVGADNPPEDHEMTHYLKAKQAADKHLQASGLTYSILRPVALTDDPKTDAVKLGNDVDQGAQARRADVAAVLAEAAVTGRHDGKVQEMQTI